MDPKRTTESLLCVVSSRYNKRINDIRECKEQALSHAYVHRRLLPHTLMVNRHFLCDPFTFLRMSPVLPTFNQRFNSAPSLESLFQGASHKKNIPLFLSSRLPFFLLSSSLLFVSPARLSRLCFYPHYLFLLPLSSSLPFCRCHPSSAYFCPPAGLS